MIIFSAELDDTAVNAVIEKALGIVKAAGGTPGTVDRWGKRAFAYEMHKKREGYYVVVDYTAEPAASADLDRFLVLADEVMRHKIMRLPDKVAGRARTKAPAAPPAPVPAPAPETPETAPAVAVAVDAD
jgi:small subunit ribosomal protein S6